MDNIWLQLIVTSGATLTGVFFTIRYAMKQISRREKALLEHTEKTQETMLEYFETKNGHLERVSNEFTKSSNKMAKAIAKLSKQIAILSTEHK